MPVLSLSFSILERIDVGETVGPRPPPVLLTASFSILERIDVGETRGEEMTTADDFLILSVSSNGSTWVKPNVQCPSQKR